MLLLSWSYRFQPQDSPIHQCSKESHHVLHTFLLHLTSQNIPLHTCTDETPSAISSNKFPTDQCLASDLFLPLSVDTLIQLMVNLQLVQLPIFPHIMEEAMWLINPISPSYFSVNDSLSYAVNSLLTLLPPSYRRSTL